RSCHCAEQSDEAIQTFARSTGLLRFARNDVSWINSDIRYGNLRGRGRAAGQKLAEASLTAARSKPINERTKRYLPMVLPIERVRNTGQAFAFGHGPALRAGGEVAVAPAGRRPALQAVGIAR